MSKDIEWLREEVENLYPSYSEVYDHPDYTSREKLDLINSFTDLIDELDEPEKIVIPKFVADWYEENLSGGSKDNRNKFSGNDVFRVIQDVLETSKGFKLFENYGIDKKIATWAEENEEDFIHLIVNCSYKEGYVA